MIWGGDHDVEDDHSFDIESNFLRNSHDGSFLGAPLHTHQSPVELLVLALFPRGQGSLGGED